MSLRPSEWVRASGAIFAIALLGSCSHPNGETDTTRAQVKDTGVITFRPDGATVRVEVEVVRSELDRARGLMYRRELAPRAGMLFVFEQSEVHSFWMKNTYISLDMIFIDEAWKVAGVVAQAEPLTTTPRTVSLPSRYVVEVNGGFCAQQNIRAGTPVSFDANL